MRELGYLALALALAVSACATPPVQTVPATTSYVAPTPTYTPTPSVPEPSTKMVEFCAKWSSEIRQRSDQFTMVLLANGEAIRRDEKARQLALATHDAHKRDLERFMEACKPVLDWGKTRLER